MGMVGCSAAVSPTVLSGLQGDPDSIEEYLYPDDGDSEPPNSIEIDKAWHGIHYLLVCTSEGGPEPLGLAVVGGEEFGPEVGYGPARFLTPMQVRDVSKALSALSPQELATRFDPKDMEKKEIYPTIWVRDEEEALAYLLEYYDPLVVFYRDAASRGDAVLQWLS